MSLGQSRDSPPLAVHFVLVGGNNHKLKKYVKHSDARVDPLNVQVREIIANLTYYSFITLESII